jgi:PAS domain S-box-containing protein
MGNAQHHDARDHPTYGRKDRGVNRVVLHERLHLMKVRVPVHLRLVVAKDVNLGRGHAGFFKLLEQSENPAVQLAVLQRLSDPDPEVREMVAVDVTDRKKAEEVQGRLAAIVESAEDAIIGKDLNGIIQYVSPSCWNVLGYPPGAMLGQSLYTWIHPEDADGVKESIQDVYRIEYRYLHADGHYLWLETLGNPEDVSVVPGWVLTSRQERPAVP